MYDSKCDYIFQRHIEREKYLFEDIHSVPFDCVVNSAYIMLIILSNCFSCKMVQSSSRISFTYADDFQKLFFVGLTKKEVKLLLVLGDLGDCW